MKTLRHTIAVLILLASVSVGEDAQVSHPKFLGPKISKIDVRDGTALDVIQQIRTGLGDDGEWALIVRVSDLQLERLKVPQLTVRNVPLGLALGYLADSTLLRTSFRDGAWCIERPVEHDDDLIARAFSLTESEFKQLGLKLVDDEVVLTSGQQWPGGEGSATFLRKNKRFVVFSQRKTLRELDALLLLRRAGYTDLTLKR